MTNIVINDLNESREMDREAMRAVTGGCANFSSVPTPYRSHIRQQDHLQNLFGWATAGGTNN